jgi:hypothetical protein
VVEITPKKGVFKLSARTSKDLRVTVKQAVMSRVVSLGGIVSVTRCLQVDMGYLCCVAVEACTFNGGC